MAREIEVRFIEVDVAALQSRLENLGAIDCGVTLMKEVIFYDNKLNWIKQRRFVRLREAWGKKILTFKHHEELAVDGTEEIETEVESLDAVKEILEKIGLVAYREQEKRCHRFTLDKVEIDFITWPKIPVLVELEGKSEADLKQAANRLGLSWNDALLKDNATILYERYNIPMRDLRNFKF